LLSFKDLWSNIVWSSANCPLPLSVELKLGSETKITYLDLHLVVEEEITQLEISMDNSMGVQVLNGITDLNDVALNLQLVKSSSSPQKFVQSLTLAEFKDDVDIVSILEEMLEAHNVGMMEGSVDLNLTHQLLLGSRFR